MTDLLGRLCIVLHGHLPYVLFHGNRPHGEAWLHEAAAETYLPLLDIIGECALHKGRPAITVGLTPILLEQLAHDRFKTGFVAYLKDRIDSAAQDRKEFASAGETHFAHLAERWEQWYSAKLEHFERIARDIPREFAGRASEGHIQILTSNATHAYMPLLLNDESIRAQMAAGTASSRRRLGGVPTVGMWLPECAYRPSWDHWVPPVLFHDPRRRPGLETFIADAGVNHFFVDSHLIAHGQPVGTTAGGRFQSSSDAQIYWDHKRGWREVLEPVGVVSQPEPPRCFAFARHPRVSEQVWSRQIGYPGAGVYLEFHKKHGERGLRYWKVTDTAADLGAKHPYHPQDVEGTLFEQARHFCDIVRDVLREYQGRTGRAGVCVASFDAELFGHWWFEGPQFLRNVILNLAGDSSVKLVTAEDVLAEAPPEKVMRLPEGSWGEKGDHRVWFNDQTRWMWEVEYRAENQMLALLRELPWRSNSSAKEMIERAGRELLLLQASDWPFVVHSHGAVDYGIERFAGHATRFQRCAAIARSLSAGHALDAVQQSEIAEIDAHDVAFDDIDLRWWE